MSNHPEIPSADRHLLTPDVSFDGGDLDCGNGLLLLIRQHIDPLPRGGLLEIRSTEISVEEDLPAWCRLTGNELVSWTKQGAQRIYLVCKGSLAERPAAPSSLPKRPQGAEEGATKGGGRASPFRVVPVSIPAILPPPAPVPPIAPLSVTGIGSWPRPRWMLQAIHEHLEGRLGEREFAATGEDAVRLAVQAQIRAGADVVTDGEQRRDSYANFVGGRLDNCMLIPLTDLLPLVDHPEEFEKELRSLDVPAGGVRHPAVFGPLGRSRAIAVHELEFVRRLTDRPVKIALPGPYLLSRIMWMECISDRAYASRERLAEDIVRVLREELHHLLAAGAALVQFDEPVLTEVVHSGSRTQRSFMCGALSAKGDTARELDFARDLLNGVVGDSPPARTAVHICRGNWTPDESAALTGDYRPLLDLLKQVRVGTCFLELCTPRAGEMEVLRELPDDRRIGVGVVNQKRPEIESVEEIAARGRRAIDLFGRNRVLLNTDCGFATFADNPVSSSEIAEGKLRAIAEAAKVLRG
ncbi:MAG: 5-methyltetrahydropteroyltriglutamate--homocysteine methyltransferase [Planctomycetes bacterium]|nr:5-methyltetrahydropteroyltriglutamate--homocysteine methyltransferase [Planctomycetota bacterium]